jgi:hypothetical protein
VDHPDSRMKLIGVCIARNEADVIETFVRHNLAVLDGLTVVDHGSTDDTPAILAALVAEGLPLRVEHDASTGFDQAEITTRALRSALARDQADWAFPLDADEFVKAPSRTVIEGVLATAPSGIHAAMAWLTYVPDFAARGFDTGTLARGARRLAQERHQLYKVVVSRDLLATPDAVVISGNHRMLSARGREDENLPHALAHRDALALAHLPIRSAGQFAAKVITNWLARIVAGREIASPIYHLREPYEKLRAGESLSVDYLTMVAANYGTPRNAWFPASAVALVDDPFLAPMTLRHTPAAPPDALASIARFAERLATG